MGASSLKTCAHIYFLLAIIFFASGRSAFSEDGGENTFYIDANRTESMEEEDLENTISPDQETSVVDSMDKNYLYPVANHAGASDQPGDIGSFLKKGKVPKYIRININGYNVRKTPEFESAKTDNLDFKSEKGSLFAVTRVQPLEKGVAVGIYVGGEERWIYVPNWRKDDFQFCETEACYEVISKVLNILNSKPEVSAESETECVVPLAEETSIAKEIASIPLENIPVPKWRPPYTKKLDENIPSENRYYRPLRVTPLWERARSRDGKQLTRMARESLATYGRTLLAKTALRDQRSWCPNYSRLTSSEREEFWIHLLNGMAKYESDFDLSPAPYDEERSINVSRGRIKKNDYSMGFFALSYGGTEQRAYRNFCKFSWSRDKHKDVSDPSLTIHDPKKQMDCAVGILNHLVGQDGAIGGSVRGGARWWSVLRDSNVRGSRGIKSSLKRYRPCWG
ncbi:MAG: hypothetical protein M9962_00995 [Oligoflexia bacterium]|nr:hypothetical protein [Oligoflexia bacterium]